MMDLYETPISLSQSTSSTNPQSQSVKLDLGRTTQRAHSVVSDRSLFSNSTSPSAKTAVPVKDDCKTDSNDVAIEQSGNVLPCASDESVSIAPVRNTSVSSLVYMLDSSLDTSIEERVTPDKLLVENDKLVPEDTVQSNEDNFGYDNRRLSSTPLKQSNQKNDLKTDSEIDTILGSDVFPTVQLSSSLPLSPESREIHDLLLGSFDSSKIEGDSVSFEDNIPCAQVSKNLNISSTHETNKVGLSEHDPNWNTTEKESSPSKFGSYSQASMESVLLEYDMPEINLSHTLTQDSENSTLMNLSSQNLRILSQGSQQVSSALLRKQLLKLCTETDVFPSYSENIDPVKGEELSEDSEAEETFMMSQQVWDILEEPSFSKNDSEKQADSTEKVIPQLDGGTESPRAVKKPSSHKKTLGIRRRRSKSMRRVSVEKSSSEPAATGSSEKDSKSASISSKSVTPAVKETKRHRLSLKRRRKPPVGSTVTPPINTAPNNAITTTSTSNMQLLKLARANNFTLNVEKVSIPSSLSGQEGKKTRGKRSKREKIKPSLHKNMSLNLAKKREKRYRFRCRLKQELEEDWWLKKAIKMSIQSSSDNSIKFKEASSRQNSKSSSVDLDRTVIEESPVNNVFSSDDTGGSANTQEAVTVSVSQVIDEDKTEENSEDGEGLDTSFCSIPESPPFTSSPVPNDSPVEIPSDASILNSSVGSISSDTDEVKSKLSSLEQSTHISKDEDFRLLEIESMDYTSIVTKPSSPLGLETDSFSSQSSVDRVHNMSCEDFHLAVTSESEGELLGTELINRSKSLETSFRENRLSSRITLKPFDLKTDDIDNALVDEGSPLTNLLSQHKTEQLEQPKSSFSCIFKPVLQKATNDTVILTPKICPPSVDYLMSTLSKYDLPSERHQQPFYRDPEHVQPPKYVRLV